MENQLNMIHQNLNNLTDHAHHLQYKTNDHIHETNHTTKPFKALSCVDDNDVADTASTLTAPSMEHKKAESPEPAIHLSYEPNVSCLNVRNIVKDDHSYQQICQWIQKNKIW
jgi:hypothetical protein